MPQNQPPLSLFQFTSRISSTFLSPFDESLLFIGLRDGTLISVKTETMEIVSKEERHSERIENISANNVWVVSSSSDGQIIFWLSNEGKIEMREKFEFEERGIWSSSAINNSHAVAAMGNQVMIFNLIYNNNIVLLRDVRLENYITGFNSLRFSHFNGGEFFAGTHDSLVVFDEKGHIVKKVRVGEPIKSLSPLSPNSSQDDSGFWAGTFQGSVFYYSKENKSLEKRGKFEGFPSTTIMQIEPIFDSDQILIRTLNRDLLLCSSKDDFQIKRKIVEGLSSNHPNFLYLKQIKTLVSVKNDNKKELSFINIDDVIIE